MKKKIEETIPALIIGWVLGISLFSLPIMLIILIWFGESELLMDMCATSGVIFVTSLVAGILLFAEND